MSPWIWATGALLVALVELVLPGVYLIWLALGAAITAVASILFPLALEGQLETFAAASILSCVVGYFVYRKLMRPRRGEAAINQPERRLVGTRGIVAVPIRNGRGKVRLGDSVWLAEGPDLAEGAPIVVRAMRGTTAIVEAAG
jgi:hypothetical protein